MANIHLTFDEAALFNSYHQKSRRGLIEEIIRAEKHIEDPDAKNVARSLRYKMREMSNEEYKRLYKQIPLPTGF